MTNTRTYVIVLLAALLFLLYSAVFIVDQRERALVVRLGEIQRTISEPGLYFKVPFIDERILIEGRMVFFESTDKTVQVVDGRRYQVDAITMVRIVDPRKFRETVDASLARARDRIETRLDAALRQTYGRRSFDAALSLDRPVMMREIRDQVRAEAISLGVDIIDVRVRRTDLMPEVLQDTYDRMSAERLAEAAELRAIGEAQSIKVKAEADRQVVELVSTARRESEIIRGSGDAERNNIYAAAFSRDPEFFSFYRSLQAYTHSLAGQGTNMVLNPDSDFLKYFSRENLPVGGARATAPGAGGNLAAPAPADQGTASEPAAPQP